MSTDTYWEFPENGKRKYDQAEFRKFFYSNTKLHLQSDVPVATTLSGGMDSSSITAISALHKSTIQRLTAFSAHPPETYNESRWINQIVNFHKLDHKYLKLEYNNVSDIILVVNHIIGQGNLNETQICSSDMNEDGSINVSDIIAIVNLIIGL